MDNSKEAEQNERNYLQIQEIEKGILSIAINSPKTLNALNMEIMGNLLESFKDAAGKSDVKVILLTGIGKAFVAGADISSLAHFSPSQASDFSTCGNELMNLLEEIPKPIIAVINGFALGGGLELAMACDFRFAADDAILGLPETLLGIIPGFGGTQRLPYIVGFPKAKEFILTGKKLEAYEALECGLVNRVFSKESLWDESVKFSKEMSHRSTNAFALAIKILNVTRNVPLSEGLCLENKAFYECFEHPDSKEGITAFLGKRSPEYGKKE